MSIIDSRPTTLLNRLTAARAAFLDAATTSRAAAATALSTGQWTNARAANLDNLDQLVSLSGAKAPTTNGLKGVRTTLNANFFPDGLVTANTTTSTFNVWAELLGEASASGVISVLAVMQNANTNSLDWGARLSIDGKVVWPSSNSLWNNTSHDGAGVTVIGIGQASDDILPQEIHFKSSFSLEIRKNENSAGTIDVNAQYRYYLTG